MVSIARRVGAAPREGLNVNDARVLVVGGESGVARAWLDDLRGAGANVAVVGDGAAALRHLALIEPEIILLDLRLPGPIDGFDTCRAIRTRSPAIVVMAAETVGVYDEVVALAVGADHFIHSQTGPEVVIARLRSLIRRARGAVLVDAALGAAGTVEQRTPVAARRGPVSRNGHHPDGLRGDQVQRPAQLALLNGANGTDPVAERIQDGDLDIDLVAREVRVGGTLVQLTRIEFDLLVTLARHPRRVFSREQLMASAWDEPFDGSHVLDAHLSRMRGKVGEAGGERVAHSVRGVGYRLRA